MDEQFAKLDGKIDALGQKIDGLGAQLRQEVDDLGRQMRVLHEETQDSIKAVTADLRPQVPAAPKPGAAYVPIRCTLPVSRR